MPRDPQILVFVGIKNGVVALDDRTGVEVWRAKLRSSDHVMVFWDGEALFATTSGEVWRLDPKDGRALWHNELKGLGRGLVSLASTRLPSVNTNMEVAAAKRLRDAAAAAAAAS